MGDSLCPKFSTDNFLAILCLWFSTSRRTWSNQYHLVDWRVNFTPLFLSSIIVSIEFHRVKKTFTIQNSVERLQLILRLLFASGTDGAGAGAVGGAVTIVLWRWKHIHSDQDLRNGGGHWSCVFLSECEVRLKESKATCFVNSTPTASLTHLLLLDVLHSTHQRQIEADAEAVLEEERGAATVQLTFGNDADSVTQQVGLVHVVSR